MGISRRDITSKITAHYGTKDRVLYDVVEEIRRAFRELTSALSKPTSTDQPAVGGGGTVKSIQNVPYPFVLEESTHLFPDGLRPNMGVACTLIAAEIHCDPTFTAPTGDVTFTIQNHATAPTQTATITVSSGDRSAYNDNMNLTFAANDKLYVKSPANLRGLQNIYVLRLGFK